MLTVLVVVLMVTMAAFVLRALAGPVAEVFTGRVLSPPVAAWSTRDETRVRQQTEQASYASANGARDISAEQRATRWADRAFPIDYGRIQPTRFGSILSAAARYLRLVYRMEGIYWWPRLSPLVPEEFLGMLGGAQAPMMAQINLWFVFVVLALGGACLLVPGGHVTEAVMVLGGGLLLAWLCYRPASSLAAEPGSLLRVGFDLYRHEILRQMDLEVPAKLEDERLLWRQITSEMPARRDSDEAQSQSQDGSASRQRCATPCQIHLPGLIIYRLETWVI